MSQKSLGSTKVSLATVIIVIVSVATAVAVYWIQTEEPVVEAYGISLANKNVANFSEKGNLVKNNPGLEKDAWYLLYEKPGSPAKSAKLSFTNKSECNFSGENESCQLSKLRAGKRAEITGRLGSGTVEVQTLKIIK